MSDERDMRDRDEVEQGDAGTDTSMAGADEAEELGASPDSGGAASVENGGGRGDAGDSDTSGDAGEVAAEVESLREELASLNNQHLRLAAEFDNYRKRNERERQALATRLQADIVTSLLDVIDDLQRVAESGEDADTASVVEGVRLVQKKFVSVLESAGLEAVDAEGERFDPEVMEALMSVPTDDPDQDEHVADVFQRGYRFRDRLVRPARVRVWQYEGE